MDAAIAAALVGLALGTVLGLLGGGGGILAIPLIVHVLGQSIDEASTTSLIVVAIGAAAGLIPHAIAGRVDWRAGLTFGALGVAGATLGARAALVADDRLQTAGLIALIFLAASGMLRDAGDAEATRMRHRIPVDEDGLPIEESALLGPLPATPTSDSRSRWTRLVASATVVGLVTGFFGVGGGFVAVPALIFGAGLAVRTATATGLLVIVINSVVAFAARGPGLVDWEVAGWIAASAAVAAVIAAIMSKRLPSRTLKRSFGFLLLIVGGYEVWQLAQTIAALNG